MKIAHFSLLVILSLYSCHHAEDRTLYNVKSELKSNLDASVSQSAKLSTLQNLLDKARKENKKLFLVFGFEKCGWCRKFARYHHDPEVMDILSRYFIVSEIDFDKTPDGKKLYQTYGSTGFPSWVIMDGSDKVLINCEAPVPGVTERTYNVGYPVGKNEMAYYLHAIKTIAPLISSSDCSILKEKLFFYHNNP
jgi:thioredoxin-related protein